MVTLSSAENVLKDVYLGVVADQINTKTNPLFSRIKRSSRNIVGKEVRVVKTIRDMFDSSCELFADNVAFLRRASQKSGWTEITYKEA